MNKCMCCKSFYEPAKDDKDNTLNPSFCESCLEGRPQNKIGDISNDYKL